MALHAPRPESSLTPKSLFTRLKNEQPGITWLTAMHGFVYPLVQKAGWTPVDGYRCDFMRSAVIGRLPERAEEEYALAIKALEAGLSALKPGKPLAAAWQGAADTFRAAGRAGGPTLTWGHGIGLDHWEPPQISGPGTDTGDLIARPGMVLCIEPSAGSELSTETPIGVFIIEDQVAVTSDGIEVLTSPMPRALFRA